MLFFNENLVLATVIFQYFVDPGAAQHTAFCAGRRIPKPDSLRAKQVTDTQQNETHKTRTLGRLLQTWPKVQPTSCKAARTCAVRASKRKRREQLPTGQEPGKAQNPKQVASTCGKDPWGCIHAPKLTEIVLLRKYGDTPQCPNRWCCCGCIHPPTPNMNCC